MKPIPYLLYISIFINALSFLSSCTPEEIIPGPDVTDPVKIPTPVYGPAGSAYWLPVYGLGHGLKNDHAFAFNAEVNKNKSTGNYFAIISTCKDSIILREIMTIPMSGDMSDPDRLTYGTVDYDVLLDGYILDTTKPFWVQVIRLDTVNMEAEGRYEAHFNIQNPNSKRDKRNPNTVAFTGMHFTCEIR